MVCLLSRKFFHPEWGGIHSSCFLIWWSFIVSSGWRLLLVTGIWIRFLNDSLSGDGTPRTVFHPGVKVHYCIWGRFVLFPGSFPLWDQLSFSFNLLYMNIYTPVIRSFIWRWRWTTMVLWVLCSREVRVLHQPKSKSLRGSVFFWFLDIKVLILKNLRWFLLENEGRKVEVTSLGPFGSFHWLD